MSRSDDAAALIGLREDVTFVSDVRHIRAAAARGESATMFGMYGWGLPLLAL